MVSFLMLAPIIAAVVVWVYAVFKGFNRPAFFIAAGLGMLCAMFAMRNDGTWYSLLFGLFVPSAVCYVVICLYLSIRENRKGDDD